MQTYDELRALYAGLALAGLLLIRAGSTSTPENMVLLTQHAVRLADALIEELKK